MSYIREIETLKNICAWHSFSTYCEIATIIVEFSMLWGKEPFILWEKGPLFLQNSYLTWNTEISASLFSSVFKHMLKFKDVPVHETLEFD